MTEEPFQKRRLADETATVSLGQELARLLRKGDCLLLSGDLGTGKTTLARAIIRSLLDDPLAEVPSPTFTLVNAFECSRFPIHHFDLYRLENPDELVETGFLDFIEEGVTFVEWPERAASDVPTDALLVRLEEEDDARSVVFFGKGAWQERFQRASQIEAFLAAHGWRNANRLFLQGDASTRSYEKLAKPDGCEAILMNAPASRDGPVIQDGKRYSELAHLAEDVGPFIAIGETLRSKGFPAPRLLAHDMHAGLLLVEDFGSHKIADETGPIEERYAVVIDLLAAMHEQTWPEEIILPDGAAYRIAVFDRPVFTIETSLLIDWYAPNLLGHSFDETAIGDYRAIWNTLFDIVMDGEQSLFLRDVHSPNLMWREGESGIHQIGLIDYQDALFGPSAYDVASLAQDARVTIPVDMEGRLKARYVAARTQTNPSFDASAFERDYAIIAAERATRLLGLWPRLKYRDHKPHYMQHMPRTIDYLTRTLTHPVLRALKDWFQRQNVFNIKV